MKRSEEDVGWRTMNIDFIRKMRLKWFSHVERKEENRALRRAMKLEVEDRRPVGSPKKTWSKVVEKNMMKLNITEDMAEDRHQWRRVSWKCVFT